LEYIGTSVHPGQAKNVMVNALYEFPRIKVNKYDQHYNMKKIIDQNLHMLGIDKRSVFR